MAEKRLRGEVRNDKLQNVAASLFLKKGYEGVTVDMIVEQAGGSKSTVYSEFGGKCGLFISSIARLCRESNEPLSRIDYAGLSFEQSLKKLAFHILKQITTRRSVELHRLVIGESANCPELGEAWYIHGPARTTAVIQDLLEKHSENLRGVRVPVGRVAVLLHDALTGDVLNRLVAGAGKPYSNAELEDIASAVVDIVLGNALGNRIALNCPPASLREYRK